MAAENWIEALIAEARREDKIEGMKEHRDNDGRCTCFSIDGRCNGCDAIKKLEATNQNGSEKK